jgi:NitT/TauT family transport system substrate-binding protein
VAINTLKSMGDLAIRETVRKDGGDLGAVKFVELPFPDRPAALEGGDVDAVWLPEPFVGGLVGGGATLVTYATQAAVSGFPTQYIFTSEKLAKSEPDLVKAMTAALQESLEYADEHPDEVKASAAELIGIPPEALAGAEVEAFGTDLREEQLTEVGVLMREDDLSLR